MFHGGVPVGCGDHAQLAGRLAIEVPRLGIVPEAEQNRSETGQRRLRDVAGAMARKLIVRNTPPG